MRRKILTVSLDLLLAALSRDDRKAVKLAGGRPPFITCDGMPDDARIIDVRPNSAFTGQLDLLVESETFEETKPGRALPYLVVQFSTYTSYETYLEMTGAKPDKSFQVSAPAEQTVSGIRDEGTYADWTARSFGTLQADALPTTGDPLGVLSKAMKAEAAPKPMGREFI